MTKLCVQIGKNLSDYKHSSLNSPAWHRKTKPLTTLYLLNDMLPPKTNKQNQQAKHQYEGRCGRQLQGLEKLEAYMHGHLAHPVSIADMTKVSGYSRSHLHKLCQQKLGVSPMVWLRNTRLEASYHYLEQLPHANITDVALLHGFGHTGRFSQYFFQRFGCYPSDMRKK